MHTFEGFSGHSGRREIINFMHKLNPRPKRVILNHGESSRSLDLSSTLHKTFKIETSVPRNLESLRLK